LIVKERGNNSKGETMAARNDYFGRTFSTDTVADPLAVANYASAILAADKGIPSDVIKTDYGYKVVTDENAVFEFHQG
jgi:hypothetical protein